jgi:hypothetical protein
VVHIGFSTNMLAASAAAMLGAAWLPDGQTITA